MKNKAFFYHVAIFYSWIASVLFTILIYCLLSYNGLANFDESKESLAKIMSILIPQLILMATFFFSKNGANILKHKHLNVCLTLTIIYHICFYLLLYVGVYRNGFKGSDIDKNVSTLTTLMGYLSTIGITPAGYLFSTSGKKNKQTPKQDGTTYC